MRYIKTYELFGKSPVYPSEKNKYWKAIDVNLKAGSDETTSVYGTQLLKFIGINSVANFEFEELTIKPELKWLGFPVQFSKFTWANWMGHNMLKKATTEEIKYFEETKELLLDTNRYNL